MVIEFCPGGNLLNVLLNSRVGYPSPENSSSFINVTSTLNHRQLLKIAEDISNGMIHLSSQKVFSWFANVFMKSNFPMNRQFQLLVYNYACRGRWEVRYQKIEMVAV